MTTETPRPGRRHRIVGRCLRGGARVARNAIKMAVLIPTVVLGVGIAMVRKARDDRRATKKRR